MPHTYFLESSGIMFYQKCPPIPLPEKSLSEPLHSDKPSMDIAFSLLREAVPRDPKLWWYYAHFPLFSFSEGSHSELYILPAWWDRSLQWADMHLQCNSFLCCVERSEYLRIECIDARQQKSHWRSHHRCPQKLRLPLYRSAEENWKRHCC